MEQPQLAVKIYTAGIIPNCPLPLSWVLRGPTRNLLKRVRVANFSQNAKRPRCGNPTIDLLPRKFLTLNAIPPDQENIALSKELLKQILLQNHVFTYKSLKKKASFPGECSEGTKSLQNYKNYYHSQCVIFFSICVRVFASSCSCFSMPFSQKSLRSPSLFSGCKVQVRIAIS